MLSTRELLLRVFLSFYFKIGTVWNVKRSTINYSSRVTSITWDCTGQTSPGMSCSSPFHVCLSATHFGRPTSSILQEGSLEYFGLLLSELLRQQWGKHVDIRMFYIPQVKNYVLLFVVYLFFLLPIRTQYSWAQGLSPWSSEDIAMPKVKSEEILVGLLTYLHSNIPLYDCD